jgi:hypothetical protein
MWWVRNQAGASERSVEKAVLASRLFHCRHLALPNSKIICEETHIEIHDQIPAKC